MSTDQRTGVLSIAVLLGALLACKSEEKKPEAVPTAAAAPAATPAKPAEPTPSTAPAATADKPSVDEKGIPAIPDGKSNPPTGAEWSAASEINTQDANSRAKGCFVKIVREWMKVHCEGDVRNVSDMEGIPKSSADYYESIQHGKMADFVIRLKKPATMKMKIHRKDNRASLFVNWPASKDRPVHVAFAQIKQDEEAAGANAVNKDDDDQAKKAKAGDQEAQRKCARGDKGACMQFCGEEKCN